MIKYQRLHVGGENIGEPADLPDELFGLADESLSDLSWVDIALGYYGQGFVPVGVADPEPVPPPVTKVSALIFKLLFTVQERLAIRAAATTNPVIADWLDLSNSAVDVHLDSPVTTSGVGALEMVGLLAPGRAAMILAAVPHA